MHNPCGAASQPIAYNYSYNHNYNNNYHYHCTTLPHTLHLAPC